MSLRRNSDLIELLHVEDGDSLTIRDVSDITNQPTGETKRITRRNILAAPIGSPSFLGGATFMPLATPAAPTVVVHGATGTATWRYRITARSNTGETLASPEATITTGNATLSATNFNRISWAAVTGAVDYRVYRTTSGGTPTTLGIIGTVAATTLDDVGQAGDGQAVPGVNTSGNVDAGAHRCMIFTPRAVAQEVWRRDDANNSSFAGNINSAGTGGLTATNVPFINGVNMLSLPNFASPQFGRVILHNTTRGNERRISGVDLVANVITTEPSTDNWAHNDAITISSQTCRHPAPPATSNYFDLDISAEVPASARVVLLEIFNTEESGIAARLQNNFGCHPFEAYGGAKSQHHFASAARQVSTTVIALPLNSQRICVHITGTNASNTIALIRLRGFWE